MRHTFAASVQHRLSQLRKATQSGYLKETIVFVTSFFFILLFLHFLRNVSQNADKRDAFIETSWIFIALVPLVVWLVITERIKSFVLGPSSLSLELKNTLSRPIAEGFGRDSIKETVRKDIQTSGGVDLKEVIDASPEILTMRIGRQYTDDCIIDWVQQLMDSGTLRWVAFLDEDGRLLMYISPSNLLIYLRRRVASQKPDEKSFSDNIKDDALPEKIRGARYDRLQTTTSDLYALKYLVRSGSQEVAVININGELEGLLRQSDLLAGFLSHYEGDEPLQELLLDLLDFKPEEKTDLKARDQEVA